MRRLRCCKCLPALLAVWLGLVCFATTAGAAGTLGEVDTRCLGCHSMPGLAKQLGDGDSLALNLHRDAYAGSVHAMFGCTACHAEVNPAQHPVPRTIASARDYSIEQSQACRKCHAGTFERYEQSVHASLVAAGDENAPICSTCHDPHAVQKQAARDGSGALCASCHQDIFEAYAGSVHGQARIGEGKAHAPICMDCHQAHDVTAIAAGDRLKSACLGCHEDAPSRHDAWLPNATTHLEAVACPACHSPMAERAVELMLFDEGEQRLVTESLDDPRFQARAESIDSAGDGLDPLELWTLLADIKREQGGPGVTLRGRLRVPGGPDAHRLAVKLEAVRDCGTCHQRGAEPFQNVTVSVGGADGRRVQVAADASTLTSAASVDSVSGFYTAGGTRIVVLDILLVLAVAAGMGIPLAHMALRRFFNKRR